MAKSRDAFRTISEVAEGLETPAHVLRFWESKFSQVKPVKRAGGRRYYRPSDIDLLSGIKKLLHEEGMTIKGVQKVLREQGVRHVSALASQSEAEPASGPSDDLIEDAPYTEVTLSDDTDAVIAFPKADAPRSAPVAPEPLDPWEPAPPLSADADRTEDPVPDDDVAERGPGDADPPFTADAVDAPSPEDSVAPSHEPVDPLPDPAPQPDEAEVTEETPPVSANQIDDTLLPPDTADQETPPARDRDAAGSRVPMDEKTPRPEVSEPDLPEPAVAKGNDPFSPETVTQDRDAQQEGPDSPVEDPATQPSAAPLPPPAKITTRPVQLQDFDAPPVAARAPAPRIGPLGHLARISALSPETAAGLAEHLPALQGLRDRLSAPLQ